MNTKEILKFINEQEIDSPIFVWQLPNGMFKYEHIDNINKDKRNIQTGLIEYKERLGYYKKDDINELRELKWQIASVQMDNVEV